MNEVLGENCPVVASNRSRRGIDRICRPHQGTNDGVGVFRSFEDQQHGRAPTHEGHKVGIEGLLDMLGVVLGQRGFIEKAKLGGDDLQALLLETVEDTTHISAFYGIGLTDHKGTVHGDQTRSIGPASKPFVRPRFCRDHSETAHQVAIKPSDYVVELDVMAVRSSPPQPVNGSRGASLVEYSLAMALILVLTIAALASLTTGSGNYLSQTGDDIGRPPEHVADLEPSLPDAPSWIGTP